MKYVATIVFALFSAVSCASAPEVIPVPAVVIPPVSPVQTIQECIERPIMGQRLKDMHRERPAVIGVTPRGGLMEFFLNSVNGTWTVVVTDGAGLSCIVTSGTNFILTPIPPEGPET